MTYFIFFNLDSNPNEPVQSTDDFAQEKSKIKFYIYLEKFYDRSSS